VCLKVLLPERIKGFHLVDTRTILRGHANLPRLTEQDQELLKQLLGNDEQAQALGGMLQNSPPEIAALGYLILRVFERSQS